MAEHASQLYCADCRSHCAVADCQRPVKSIGYCLMHYRRLKKHGDLNFGRAERVAQGFHGRAARSPRVTLTCEQCGDSFSSIASHVVTKKQGRRKYCSNACRVAAQRIVAPTFDCESCGATVARTKNATNGGYNYRQRFCSKSCADIAQTGDGFIDKNGYRVIRVDGQAVFEHRHVMELKLGRKLSPHETVHHVNGERTFNSESNLELWSSRHGKGQRVADKIAFARSILAEYGATIDAYSATRALVGTISEFG